MTSPFLEQIAGLLAERGISVHRFEFAYMSARREGGGRKPPPKAELLTAEYESAVRFVRDRLTGSQQLVIGGKSMGGRVASMVAEKLWAEGTIAGLSVLGYPFHPPGKPQSLRTTHLQGLTCPALIVQGERDPFGTREEVEGYALSLSIALHWVTGGDHDLVARKGTGPARAEAMSAAADAIARFCKRVCEVE